MTRSTFGGLHDLALAQRPELPRDLPHPVARVAEPAPPLSVERLARAHRAAHRHEDRLLPWAVHEVVLAPGLDCSHRSVGAALAESRRSPLAQAAHLRRGRDRGRVSVRPSRPAHVARGQRATQRVMCDHSTLVVRISDDDESIFIPLGFTSLCGYGVTVDADHRPGRNDIDGLVQGTTPQRPTVHLVGDGWPVPFDDDVAHFVIPPPGVPGGAGGYGAPILSGKDREQPKR